MEEIGGIEERRHPASTGAPCANRETTARVTRNAAACPWSTVVGVRRRALVSERRILKLNTQLLLIERSRPAAAPSH